MQNGILNFTFRSSQPSGIALESWNLRRWKSDYFL